MVNRSYRNYQIIVQFCSRHKVFTQLSAEKQNQFIQQALECGRKIACTMQQNYPNVPLEKLANQLGVIVHYNYETSRLGTLRIYAKYSGNPPTITIYRKAIQQLAEKNNHEIAVTQLEQIALAHELYHHLNLYKVHGIPYGLQSKEQREKLPRLFDELAAQSFTQHYLGLAFFPCMLDFTE
ncbi:MAG: metallopeptidase family protein [bacterium]|nr:metallopeptidase family protein [bacterium]